MRTMLLFVTACAALGGCVVVRDHPGPPPPPSPPRTTVTVTYGWNHHRYVLWREYYGCSDEEVYYLENCGYDDDDALVCLYIARRARMPLRHVFFEYDRCGRSHYTLAMSYRLPWDIWFVNDVPRGYGCPPVYARCYGDYWSGQRRYYSNDEIHALVQFQVGVRYYGYSHATYFRDYDGCVQRGERTPFRTIVVKDHHAAGRGGKGWDEQRVVVRNDRPWNAPNPQAWEKQRQAERQQVQVRYTPQRQREEEDQAKKAVEARKDAHEEAKRQAEEAKARRQDDDRRRDAEERAKGPKPPVRPDVERPGRPEVTPKGPEREPGPTPPKKPDVRRPDDPPKGPEREPGPPPPRKPDVERPKDPSPPRGPERPKDPPPPPPRQPDRPKDPPPPPPRGPERRDPPPPPPKGPEREKTPPPPPPKKNDDGPKKGPPPSDDDKRKKGR